MKRLPVFILTLMLWPMGGQAQPLPGQQVIGPSDVVRGTFTQEHNVKTISTKGPLVAEGHFVIAPATGLIWALDKPFPTESVVTKHGMVQMVAQMPIAQMQAAQMPYILRMYGDLCAALSGDWQKLEGDFIVRRTPENNGHWRVDLTPLQPDNKAMPFQSITLHGSRFVETAIMTKPDGNFDRLTFINPAVTAAPPAADELAMFNAAPR